MMNHADHAIPGMVAVAGHRGGCGKTALATLIASHWAASHGQRVLLVDFTADGSAAWLMLGPDQKLEPVDLSSGQGALKSAPARDSSARAIWAPGHISRAPFWRRLQETVEQEGFDRVLIDLPVAGADEFDQVLRHAALVLLAVPCDGPAFRSLGPLLEMLDEERSRPHRHFQVRAVMTMTGVPNPERQALEAFEKRYLRPLLLEFELPFDPELRRAMAQGRIPLGLESLQPGGATTAALGLAAEILELAGVDPLLTPVVDLG